MEREEDETLELLQQADPRFATGKPQPTDMPVNCNSTYPAGLTFEEAIPCLCGAAQEPALTLRYWSQ